ALVAPFAAREVRAGVELAASWQRERRLVERLREGTVDDLSVGGGVKIEVELDGDVLVRLGFVPDRARHRPGLRDRVARRASTAWQERARIAGSPDLEPTRALAPGRDASSGALRDDEEIVDERV